MDNFNINYRRILPHFQNIGATFFVTWRLFDSMPKDSIERLKSNWELKQINIKRQLKDKIEINKLLKEAEIEYWNSFEKYLDNIKYGSHCLKNPEVAQLVLEKIKSYDGKYYIFEACCIMSNHVHVLLNFNIQIPENEEEFDIRKYVQLDKVLKYIKGGSSKEINKLLNRTGQPFWNEINFDRYIRNEKHFNSTINYIINNPVNAGLVNNWDDYPYSYLRIIEHN